MGVLRLLNVAPTQLHPNNWAYLQAFRLLCMALYLQPSLRAFLYFFDTRLKSPTTWLSLVSRPEINRLDAFTQSFKHFKDGFFKVVVKEVGRSHFYTNDGGTKFPFFWIDNPWRYKGMAREELLVANREVVDAVMRFSDKMPTKGLVRVYNSVHPIIDIEGHMVQMGKKNESLVDVHVHGGMKRKVELPARPSRGKDVKKVRAALLGSGSSSGTKGLEAGLTELLETTVWKDIEINMPEMLINSIDSMEPNHLVRTMVEFSSKALILGRRVGSLYQRELKEGNRDKLAKLQGKVDKVCGGEGSVGEGKGTLERREEEAWDLEKHINGFKKGLRQATFFCKDVDVTDPRFDVNKDVVDDQLINEAESCPEEEAEKTIIDEDMNAGEAVEGRDDQAA
ncbi:hypothetical protein DEO72_LG6g934 [Vigna unguiculata]|uniref:Transposase n=1 Tax=Vigna unguiculata TaxID=3917 RepID=A0A4D6M4N4_VIGUN|nr:hypothetical protein DEO72_LG6g934 [Vigna unguiculata]